METAHRRKAVTAMGTLPKFAGGGLIEGFKKVIGITPESPELKAYKERAAAERASKPAAAPAAPAAAPKSAIGDYAGNAPLEKRMKAADAMASGGPIKGPGTGTSDEVPILASNGEYVIRAAAVEEVGTEVLDAINALGEDKSEADDPEDKQPGQYAVGGVVDERQRLVNQIPTGGTGRGPTPQPNASLSASGSELGRNVANIMMALPGASPAFGAMSRLASAAPVVNRTASATAGAAQGLAGVAKPALPFVPPAVGAGALAAGASSGQAPATQPAASTLPGAPAAAPIPGGATPSMGSRNPAMGSPDEPGAETKGQVKVERQANGNMSFSGEDISGTPQYTGGAAARMANTKGNLSVMPAMSQEVINRTLTNPDGSRWSDGDNAVMAANIRDGVDPMRGTQRGMAEEKMARLQSLALSPNGTPGKTNAMKILAMQSDERRTGAAQQTEREKLALTAKGTELDNAVKQQTLDAQRALTEAKTPADKRGALEVLAGMQGRMSTPPQDEYAYAPGGQEVDPATGQLVTRPGVIFNKRTGATGAPQQGAQGGSINTDPRAIAIRDNKQLTREQKLAELKKIGYQ